SAAVGLALTAPTARAAGGNEGGGAGETAAGAVSDADVIFADRVCELAQGALKGKYVLPPNWKQSIILLDAAMRLNPKEPSYPLLQSEAALTIHDGDKAIEALKKYRLLDPADKVAQIKLMDLYLNTMQTADDKVEYLKKLTGQETVSKEVRAQAAVACARVLFDRSEDAAGREMLDSGMKLNPVNLAGLQMRYDMVAQTGGAADRVEALVGLLRANPAQPTIASSLAHELAESGLVNAALTWYSAALTAYKQTGQAPPPAVVLEYAAALSVADQVQSASSLAGQLIQYNVNDVDAWFLFLSLQRRVGNSENGAKILAHASIALQNRLQVVRKEMGDITATTRPVEADEESALPDLSADIKNLKEKHDEELKNAYVAVLADMAWFELYYNNKPQEAMKLIEVLTGLLPEGNVTVTRLEGWNYLKQGKPDEARVKLSAIADRDPLAAAGMALIEAKTSKEKAADEAAKILGNNPSGLLAAQLWEILRDTGARPVAQANAGKIQEIVDKFPTGFLDVVEMPGKFYLVKASPMQVAHEFAVPMFARVTIQNVGDFPLTIDAEGLIHPDLWVDAQIKGVAPQYLPRVAYARIGHEVVLAPQHSVTQVVRIDDGVLQSVFRSRPQSTIQLVASVITNPTSVQGNIGPGPAGQKVAFNTFLERTGRNLLDPTAKNKLFNTMANGTAAEKIRGVELLTSFVQVFRQNPQPQAKPLENEFVDMIRKATNDTTEGVGPWASYLYARLATPEERAKVVSKMLEDADWQRRLLGVVAVQGLDLAQQKAILKTIIESDKDDQVKQFAAAVQEFNTYAATQPAATQPATNEAGAAPATMP
ncbi:MAG TPA: hypothetical protein VIL86_19405, partial [Tepidisphaeraceae bacterium]